MLCAAYPKDERSTDSCVRRIAEAQRKDGFKRTNDTSLAELGHATFARTDLVKEGPLYEATFVRHVTAGDSDCIQRL